MANRKLPVYYIFLFPHIKDAEERFFFHAAQDNEILLLVLNNTVTFKLPAPYVLCVLRIRIHVLIVMCDHCYADSGYVIK